MSPAQRAAFERPHTEADTLANLYKSCVRLGKQRGLFADADPIEAPQVMLCLSCDPYQTLDVTEQVTRKAITVMHEHQISVRILTKGGLRSTRDFDLLTLQDNYGATLTTLDPAVSAQWEPGAALPAERLEALRQAHALGISTWACLEPVLDPQMTLDIIEATHSYVDQYMVGVLNYHPHRRTINWPLFREQVIGKLGSLGANYTIKHDLLMAN